MKQAATVPKVSSEICIGQRVVGVGHRAFLAAEAGTTCNGDLQKALRLVDAATDAGMDAIKFQTIGPHENVSDKDAVFRYQDVEGRWHEENMLKMFDSMTFEAEQWLEIAQYTRSQGLEFFSTVDYAAGIPLMEACAVPVHKMGSWDVTHEPLIAAIARCNKPVLLDLGPASLDDLLRFHQICTQHGSGDVLFLHDFHTPHFAEMNLRTIPFLQRRFGQPVGFSAPGRDQNLDVAALAMGADLIEKRITLDVGSKGHHHALSLEPRELADWVRCIRSVEQSMGEEAVRPSAADIADGKKYLRSICTTKQVSKGELLSSNNLDAKRPGTGLHTRHIGEFLGKAVRHDLAVDHLLEWDDVEPSQAATR